VQLVCADGNENIGLGLLEFLPHQLDSLNDFGATRGTVRPAEKARHEGIVSNADDRDYASHLISSSLIFALVLVTSDI
jgi:hypothetical protein